MSPYGTAAGYLPPVFFPSHLRTAETPMSTYAPLISQFRRSAGLTQRQLTARLQTTATELQLIEAGLDPAPAEVALELGAALGVSPG